MAKQDYYGNYDMNKRGILLGDLALYCKSRSELESVGGSVTENIMPDTVSIPSVEHVISCHYFPYLTKDDLNLWVTEVDTNRLQLPVASSGTKHGTSLNRIRNVKVSGQLKDVATFPKYIVKNTTIGGKWSWQNEGKLWLPPYTYIMIDDGLSEPFKIYPNLITDNQTNFTVRVRHSLNHLGIYTLFVSNYMGDGEGLLNGHTVNGLRLPNASHVYSDYMNQNRNQIKQAQNERFLNTVIGMGMVANGVLTKNPATLMTGGMSLMSSVHGENRQLAQERDLMNSGNRLTCEGSDVIHGLQITNGLTARYMQYPEEVMERIGTHFHLYGYTQQKLMDVNWKSRKYFNYVKTNGVNLSVTHCHKKHLEVLKSIFNQGVTIWHMENGAVVGDYSKDNVEV